MSRFEDRIICFQIYSQNYISEFTISSISIILTHLIDKPHKTTFKSPAKNIYLKSDKTLVRLGLLGDGEGHFKIWSSLTVFSSHGSHGGVLNITRETLRHSLWLSLSLSVSPSFTGGVFLKKLHFSRSSFTLLDLISCVRSLSTRFGFYRLGLAEIARVIVRSDWLFSLKYHLSNFYVHWRTISTSFGSLCCSWSSLG